jgi:hypothetical protein
LEPYLGLLGEEHGFRVLENKMFKIFEPKKDEIGED